MLMGFFSFTTLDALFFFHNHCRLSSESYPEKLGLVQKKTVEKLLKHENIYINLCQDRRNSYKQVG